ncbi:MAG: ABC transporter permease [Opitutaceae bacterium]|nr:ABC transporter permease [Opitutaceae bacterium]
MKRVTFSPIRVALIAEYTLREAVRQRLPLLLILVAAATVGVALVLRDFNFGTSELKFLLDAGFGALAVFGAIFGIVGMAQLFFSEIERRTVLTVLAKPVWRMEFVLGKLGGVLLLLLGYCGLGTALLAGLLWWRETALMGTAPEAFPDGRRVAYAGVALCGLVQWLKLGVLAALTLLVASYARSSLFAVGVGFLALVAGHLLHLVRDFPGNTDSLWLRGGSRLLGLALPDFQLFAVADKVAAGESLPLNLVGGIAIYAVGYMAVFSGLAVYCFRHREL